MILSLEDRMNHFVHFDNSLKEITLTLFYCENLIIENGKAIS